MKKQFQRLLAIRRFNTRRPAVIWSRHRRLMFEQCEERLALSGSSAVLGDTAPLEGGFISLNASNFISLSTNDFISTDSVEFLQDFSSWAETPLSRLYASVTPTISESDVDSVTLSWPDPIETTQDHIPNSEINNTLIGVVADALEFEPSGTSTGTILKETRDADLPADVGPSLVVINESPPTANAVEVFDASAYSAEGGPIEVALAVVETQQAYEAQVFSTVATLLDEQDILAQPTPPVRQPLSGELARSVAFEMVGLEPTAHSARFDDLHAPSAALPTSSADGAISVSVEAAEVNEADTEPSRALAFAQWPLVFSATLGAVLAGSRRRSQSRTAQLPPRRNRQVPAL